MNCPDIRTESVLVGDTLVAYCIGGKGSKCRGCVFSKELAVCKATTLRDFLSDIRCECFKNTSDVPTHNILIAVCKKYHLTYTHDSYLGLCEIIERIIVAKKATAAGYIGYLHYCEYRSIEAIAVLIGLMPDEIERGLDVFLEHVYKALSKNDVYNVLS